MRIPAIHLRNQTISAEIVQREVALRILMLHMQNREATLLLRSHSTLDSLYWILAAIFVGIRVAPIHPHTTHQEFTAICGWIGDYFETPALILHGQEEFSFPQESPALEKIWAIIFSSGSSGNPKAIAISGKSFRANAISHGKHHQLDAQDIWLLSLPLFHIGGLATITRALFLEQDLAFTEKLTEEEAIYWMESGEVSGISMVPTMLWRLLEKTEKIRCRAKIILLGGSGISPALINRAQNAQLPIRVSYGLTECCSQVSAGEAKATQPNFAGTPLPGVSVKISESGEILVRSDALASGYWNKGNNIPLPLEQEYFATGDHGSLREGTLFVTGRKDDLIISGGENIFPKEIEDALMELPFIEDVAVAGIPSAEWGEKLVAAIVLKNLSNSSDIDEQIKNTLRQKLNPWKIPKQFLFVQKIPRNTMNKIQRQAVVQLFLS